MRKEPIVETISRIILEWLEGRLDYAYDNAWKPLWKWVFGIISDLIKSALTTLIHFLIKYVVFWVVLVGAIVVLLVWAYTDFDVSATISLLKQFAA